MKKRELGNSGLSVSEISFGCMSLPTEKETAKQIVHAALDAGINYFDTADLYDRGVNEEVVGYALKEVRNEILIATKVGNRWEEGKEGWTWDSSKTYIESEVKESLRRLGTDYIDVYQLHGGTMEDNLEEVVDVFEGLKKEGVIRHYGISSIRPNVIKRFLENSKAVSVMMQYSMLDRRPEEWFPLIRENNASVVVRGALAKGLLTSQWKTKADQFKRYLSFQEQELWNTLQQLDEITDDLHSAAIQFALRNETVASLVIGASSGQQLKETMAAYENTINEDVLNKAIKHLKTDVYKEHRE